jgi:aldehyde dehydrogenase (NAD(P)+)
MMNASFMCCAAKVLVLPAGWAGSDVFAESMREICAKVAPRRAYYPGAEDRWVKLTGGRTRIQHLGDPRPGSLPWTFISGLDPKDRDEPLFTQEAFCSVISETRLANSDPVEFLQQAVEFCNDTLWGTLNANVIVHPQSLKDPRINEAVEWAIARLRYGVVAVNAFIGMPFVFAAPPWGAYPGSTLHDIQSGSGFVHNTSMLEGVEKTVFRAPLTMFPKPGYFASHRTAHKMVPKIVAMEGSASWTKVAGVVFDAVRG